MLCKVSELPTTISTGNGVCVLGAYRRWSCDRTHDLIDAARDIQGRIRKNEPEERSLQVRSVFASASVRRSNEQRARARHSLHLSGPVTGQRRKRERQLRFSIHSMGRTERRHSATATIAGHGDEEWRGG